MCASICLSIDKCRLYKQLLLMASGTCTYIILYSCWKYSTIIIICLLLYYLDSHNIFSSKLMECCMREEITCSVGGIQGCLNFQYGHRHYVCVMCIVYV